MTCAANTSMSVDAFREEAARCCEETARALRKERTPIRSDEFSAAAFDISEEACVVLFNAARRTKAAMMYATLWRMAGNLLRSGWQRDMPWPVARARMLEYALSDRNAEIAR